MKEKLLKIGMVAFFMCVAYASQAASSFAATLQSVTDEYVRPAYPIVAGMVFIFGALLNLGKFFGENRDVKQGITNIGIYLLVVIVIVGVYETIVGLSI